MKTLTVCRLLPLFFCIVPAAFAGSLPSPEEGREFSIPSFPPDGAAMDPFGNLIVAYRTYAGKISPALTRLWQVDTGLNYGSAGVAADSAGNSYIAGISYGSGFMVTKRAPNGDEVWTRDSGSGGATRIVLDDQGGVYASGYSSVTSPDLFLVKYDTGGVQQWTRRFNGSANLEDKASGLVAMPGGGVVVTGITRNSAEQFITIRYSAAGVPQWTSYYDEPGETEGMPVGIVSTSDGGLAIAGLSGKRTIATVKYSSDGVQLWANRKELPSLLTGPVASVHGIVAGPGGEAVVLGSVYARDTLPQADFTLFSVNGSLGDVWSTVIRSMPDAYRGRAALAALPGGGYLAAAGESTYSSSHTGNLAKLSCVNAAGTGLRHVEWPPPSAVSSQIGCQTLVTGHDGTVWAVAGNFGQLLVKRFGTSSPPPALTPVAVTTGFDNLQTTSVRLKGTVNPGGANTICFFEYGPTASYGSNTPQRNLLAGNTVVDAFEPGVIVAAGATYHFRLVATNAEGTGQGADMVFTVPQTAYQQWTMAAFGSLSAPGSGPGDDPDFDRVQNLVEYAFGGNATVAGQPAGLPVMEMWESPDSGIIFPSIVYYPDSTRFDVTITPVASNNLTTWSNSGVAVMNLPDGRHRAVAQGFQHFMRLQITSP